MGNCLSGITFLLLLLVGCQELVHDRYVISFNTDVVDSPSKLDLAKWKATVTEAIDSVSGYFGKKYSDTLRVILVNDGTLEGGFGHIYMTPYSFDRKDLLLHEVTHAILPLKVSNFYNEGLAVFMSEHFSDIPYIFKRFGKWVIENPDSLISIEQLAQDNSYYQFRGSRMKNLGYVEAGYFFMYLNSEYGRDAFRLLINGTGSTANYKQAFGKDLDELEKGWLEQFFPSDTLSLDSHLRGNDE